tara:strand:+ start:3490 stop:4257 length:768 start_codon:yes stop_codon:yes gene_type:complete
MKDILVSVMFPSTRGKKAIIKTLDKCFNVSNKEEVEVIIRIDDTAKRSKEWIEEIRNFDGGKHYERIKFIVGPKLWGYCSVPTFLNEMAEIASGEFFFTINDDIDDITENYTEKIKKFSEKVVLLTTQVGEYQHKFDFPIIHRKIWEVTETMSIAPFANYHYSEFDTYIPEIVKNSEIIIEHTPQSEFGTNISLGLHCDNIEDEDYIFNKKTMVIDGKEVNRVEYFVENKLNKLREHLNLDEHQGHGNSWWGGAL